MVNLVVTMNGDFIVNAGDFILDCVTSLPKSLICCFHKVTTAGLYPRIQGFGPLLSYCTETRHR